MRGRLIAPNESAYNTNTIPGERYAVNDNEKILIVDDEGLIRMNLRLYFEDMGYRVAEAANGLEGLEVFSREKPDLVFTDLRMPKMDGMTFLAKLREMSPETPTIIISGTGTMKDAIDALRAGAWDYVTKPIQEIDEIEITVKRALERARLIAENKSYRENLERLVQERTLQFREEVEVSKSLLHIVAALSETLDEKALLKKIMKIAPLYLKFDRLSVFLYEEELKGFVFSIGYGLTPVEEALLLSKNFKEEDFRAIDRTRKREIVLIDNAVDSDLLPREYREVFQAGSLIVIPISFRGQVLGGILGDYRTVKSIEQKNISLLTGLANGIGIALQNSRLYRESVERLMELSTRVETIKALSQFDREILASLDRNMILRIAPVLISKIIPCDRVAITRRDEDRFRVVSEWGSGNLQDKMYEANGSHCETFEKNHVPLFFTDLSLEDCPYYKDLSGIGIKTAIIVPLISQETAIGFIDIGAGNHGRLLPEHLSMAESISSRIAVALANGELFDELQQLLISTISSLVAAIDAKSHWTKGHAERVTRYALEIGKEMGLADEELKRLKLAGLLHDIGKIGIVDMLLEHTGKLTDTQLELIRSHPGKGADILAPLKQLSDVIPAILHHHERYDGTGHPHGLKGVEIPLFARIICVADSFDAMTADRPYRQSRGKEYAVSEFKRCRGTQFDPNVVDAFLNVVDTLD